MNFLNEVTEQLILIPEETRQMLLADMAPAELGESEQIALQVAKGWNLAILKSEMLPPDNAEYAIVAREAHRCDVIRTSYVRDQYEIDLSQTYCVFSVIFRPVKITCASARDVDLIKIAELVAREAFRESERISFQFLGVCDGLFHGTQCSAARRLEHRDWVASLRWWTDGQALGFLTLKSEREPGRAVTSWGFEFNREWFRAYNRQS